MKPAHSRKKKTKETGQPFRHLGAPSGPAVGYASSGTQILKEYPNDIMAPYMTDDKHDFLKFTVGKAYHDESTLLGIVPDDDIDCGVQDWAQTSGCTEDIPSHESSSLLVKCLMWDRSKLTSAR